MSAPPDPQPGAPEPEEEPVGEPTDPTDPLKREDRPPGSDPVMPPVPSEE
ncbi:MAG: hypothetical protein ACRDU8_01760 [Egibacteraceae bacterium]